MKRPIAQNIVKFAAAKQRRMDELLDKNSEGNITVKEKATLEKLVAEAQQLMVANSKRLARIAGKRSRGEQSEPVPVTVWLQPEPAGR